MFARIATGIALVFVAGPVVTAQQGTYNPRQQQGYPTQAQTQAGQASTQGSRPIVTPAATRTNGGIQAQVGDSYIQPQPTAQAVGASVAQGCSGCDSSGRNFGGGCDSSGRGYAGGCDGGSRIFGGGCDGRFAGGGCDGGCGCDSGNCGSCNCGCDRYVRVFGGWVGLRDMVFTDPNQTQAAITFNEGWGIGASRGRYLTCNLRWESEFTYRNNTNDGELFGSVVTPLAGNINAFSGQQILIRELPRLTILGATPYAGAGVGGCYVDADFVATGGAAAISDFAIGYQGIAGVQRQINNRVAAFAEYRYFGTGELQLETPAGKSDVHYNSDNIFFGLMIRR